MNTRPLPDPSSERRPERGETESPDAVRDEASIEELLQTLAGRLSVEWNAPRCCVFLFSGISRKLILRAAHGIGDRSIVGRFSLGIGESITGTAFAEGIALQTNDLASGVDSYLPSLPVAREFVLEYETALAVPILRGEERVGVVLLQRKKDRPFSPEEIQGIRTAVARDAGTFEVAKALFAVREKERPDPEAAVASAPRSTFRGSSIAGGAAVAGKALVVTREKVGDLLLQIRSGQRVCPPVVRSFAEAVARTHDQIDQAQTRIAERLPEAAKLIFNAQMLVLRDENFVGKIAALVRDGNDTPQHAVSVVATEYTEFFRNSGVDFLREKAADVEDVAYHLLQNLFEKEAPSADSTEGRIIVVAEFLPSDIFRIASEGTRGIVLVGGASTAHATLLLKSLGLPAVFVNDERLLQIPDRVPVLLDAPHGTVFVNPEPEVLRRCEAPAPSADTLRVLFEGVRPETRTRDGTRVRLLANVNLLSEATRAVQSKAEGIGLYRTEYPFLLHPSLPNEEDQLNIYGELLDSFRNGPVTFRTLDAGGDKILSYFRSTFEPNPALGLRSTRFTLRYPYIFDQQLRAILQAMRVRSRAETRIMFPMIGSLQEFDAACRRVDHCVGQLNERYPSSQPVLKPAIGTMVELPALVRLARPLARKAAFFSVGTNDFIQYMLAVDRTNASVRRYYVPHHPAVLEGLAKVVQAANDAHIPVCICGEMGNDPKYLPFFVGIGVREFSLPPEKIPQVQDVLASFSVADAARHAARLLEADTIPDVEKILAEF